MRIPAPAQETKNARSYGHPMECPRDIIRPYTDD